MGMFCGLGAILLTHLTASEREPAAVRVAAAAALPVVAVTLYFTFSRGGIAATLAGARPLRGARAPARAGRARCPPSGCRWRSRCSARTARTCSPATSSPGRTRASRGRTLFVVVIGCVVAAAALRALALRARPAAGADRGRPAGAPRRLRGHRGRRGARARGRDRRVRPARPHRRAALHGVRRARDARPATPATCARGSPTSTTTAASRTGGSRSTPPTQHPWRGVGAGTYRLLWEHEPPAPPVKVVDGALALLRDAGRAGLDRRRPARDRARGPARGGRLAARGARGGTRTRPSSPPGSRCWSTRTSTGTGRCPRSSSGTSARPGWSSRRPSRAPAACPSRARLTRLLAGLACLLLALTPVTVAFSQLRLNRSVEAFERGDCATRDRRGARTASTRCSVQAEAFEVLGWCDARAGQLEAGGRRDARRPRARPATTGSTPTGSPSPRRSRARTRRRERGARAAAQPARAAGPQARRAACAPSSRERRRALSRPGRRSRADDR